MTIENELARRLLDFSFAWTLDSRNAQQDDTEGGVVDSALASGT